MGGPDGCPNGWGYGMKYSGMAAAVVAMTAGASAAQDVIDLGEIVVTANKVATDAASVGTSVAVLTEAEIEAAGEIELVDLLNRLPGVSVTRAGPLGASANIRIRGADARYIAVYIDGVRVGDPSLVQTQYEFGGLTAADISRVELLRGSQSALYGGSAVGGVISITTRRADADGLSQRVRLEAGSFGTVSGSYGMTQRSARGEVALTLSHTRSDGYSAADENDGNTEADGFRTTRLSFSGEHMLSNALTVGGAIFRQEQRTEFDGFDAFFNLVDLPNEQDRSETGARAFARLDLGATEHLFELSGYGVDRTVRDEAGASEFSGRRFALAWQGTTEVSPMLTLVYGADLTEERARYDALPQGRETTRIAGVFAEALWAPTDRLDLAATVRYDDTSSFGDFTSGRLALAYRPDDTLTLRAAIARGFRAPSIDERFGNYPEFFFVGNPDLEAEESLSYEVGIEKAFAGGAVVSATLFALEIDNLILSGPPFYDTVNNVPGVSTRRGLELAANLPITDRISADLAYTYTDARRPSGAQIDLVPLHQTVLGVTAEISPRLTGRISAEHRDSVLEFGAMNPSFTVVNLGLTYALSDEMDLSLRMENLFDKEYQTVRGFGTSDRAVYVGLSSRF